MATPIFESVNPMTSYFSVYSSTGSFSYKSVNLPLITPSTIGRILYFKEASEFPGVPIFAVSSAAGNTIETSTTIGVSRHQAVTLQAQQSSTYAYWALLNGYLGNSVVSSQTLPTLSVPVYLSSLSQSFVDLRTQSKTVVLPRIASISPLSSSALFVTIKDAYGYASTSTLYVSTSYPDTLEMSSINNSIAIPTNFASVDLIGNPVLSKWNIVGAYFGELVERPL